uniref:Uncharacterized protein n=1 Tax=Arundo donax TaxID=35708 RepID=A0A0A8Y905_ARUDO
MGMDILEEIGMDILEEIGGRLERGRRDGWLP